MGSTGGGEAKIADGMSIPARKSIARARNILVSLLQSTFGAVVVDGEFAVIALLLHAEQAINNAVCTAGVASVILCVGNSRG